MGQQLPLPAGWSRQFESFIDPLDRLQLIQRDKRELLGDLREVLDRYADKHGISPGNVTAAITAYATDMISDLFYETVSEIEREREDAED